eukprot:Awhi_evm1s12155
MFTKCLSNLLQSVFQICYKNIIFQYIERSNTFYSDVISTTTLSLEAAQAACAINSNCKAVTSSDTNVALHKPVTAKDFYNNYYVPSKATNGDLTETITNCYHSLTAGANWMQIDLGQNYFLGRIELYSRMGAASYPSSAYIEFTVRLLDSDLQESASYTYVSWSPRLEKYSKVFDTSITTQYIRVETTNKYLSVRELQAFEF